MKIRDLAHLIELSTDLWLDCYIALAGGLARSSKQIYYMPPQLPWKTGKFLVLNEIDDTEQTLWPKQLWTRSNIGYALDKGALYTY